MSNWNRINYNNYELGETLGTGSYGRVKIAKDKVTGEYFALKILKKAEIIKLKQVDHVVSEHTILADIEHSSLVTLRGFDQDSRFLYLLLEYVSGGELFSHLRAQGYLNADDTRFYAGQVTLMFEYLHSK